MKNEVSTTFYLKENEDEDNLTNLSQFKITETFDCFSIENLNTQTNENCPHPLINEDILTGKDFTNDPYTFINEVKNAQEEHLLFVIHGIGQNPTKLKSTIQKIKNTMININSKKSEMFKKQIHVRVLDWKTMLLEKDKDLMNNLVDRNNHTKYPKMFIQQTPLDVLHYLSPRNKFNILNDVIRQMNDYYECIRKFRPLFKGNVSVAGHSLGSVIMYEIFTNMTKCQPNEEIRNEPNENVAQSNNLNRKKTYHLNKRIETGTNKIDRKIIKLDRKARKDNFKQLFNTDELDKEINIEDIKFMSTDLEDNKIIVNKLSLDEEIINEGAKNEKIYSKNKNINPLKFTIDHFFLLGSPLSLFLTVEHGAHSYLQEMEIVKDFHNIIHPMDPVAYRVEPMIINYPDTKQSFTLPHWENDGLRHILLYKLMKVFCCESDNQEGDIYDKKINRKRYDFMVQESFTEKAVTMVGFLFSHMAYWNNPDVFYFIFKMIHWQGYSHALTQDLYKNNYNSNQ